MKGERILAGLILCLLLLGGIALRAGLWSAGTVSGAVIRVGAGLHVPPLDDPAKIRRAAGHYDIVCANCHGSPDNPRRGDHLKLSPPAPRLHQRVEDWLPEVLFLTVKHGIPDSGMPAWPAPDREDEVWSMVAFLRVLPGLDAGAYRRLAGLGVAQSGPKPAALCLRCHGPDGRGDPNGAFPRLDIQTADYLGDALRAYATGARHSGFMAGIAQSLTPAQIDELAVLYAGDRVNAAAPPGETGPGRADNAPAAPPHIPSCAACHGPHKPARPQFPALSGQYQTYLADQLTLFASDRFTRGGGPFVALMREAGHALTPAQIADLSRFYSEQADTPPYP